MVHTPMEKEANSLREERRHPCSLTIQYEEGLLPTTHPPASMKLLKGKVVRLTTS